MKNTTYKSHSCAQNSAKQAFNNHFKLRNILVLSVLSFAFSGCALNMKATEDQATHNIQDTQALVTKASKNPSASLIHFDKGIFVADKAFMVKPAPKPLPAIFSDTFYFNSNQALSIDDIVNDLSNQTGLAIGLSDEAREYVDNSNSSNNQNSTQNNSSTPLTLSSNTQGGSDDQNQTMVLNFSGTLKNLLDQICKNFSISWRYDRANNSIEFFHYESKTFSLLMMQGKNQTKTTISSNSANSISPQSSSLTYDSGQSDQWAEAISELKGIIMGEGSVTPSPTSGYITVTTTPSLMQQAQAYINKLNQVANKSIAIKVDIYNVEQSHDSHYGVNWDAVMKASGSVLNWTTTNLPNPLSNPLSSGIQTATLKAGLTGGALAGSSLIINAIQTFGKITNVKTNTEYTLNGKPTALNIGDSIAYVKEKTIVDTGSDNDNVESSITPGTVDTGFNLKMTPYINGKNNNQVILNMSVSMATLKAMRQAQTGKGDDAGYVELPSISSKNFMHSVRLSSGEPIILASFDDDTANVNQNGIGGKDTWGYGGNKATSKTHDMTVVVVTPYVIGSR